MLQVLLQVLPRVSASILGCSQSDDGRLANQKIFFVWCLTFDRVLST